jgi:hypothetical protein
MYVEASYMVGRLRASALPAIRFEFVINLKTAEALGLDVPSHLRRRGDRLSMDFAAVREPESGSQRPRHPSALPSLLSPAIDSASAAGRRDRP